MRDGSRSAWAVVPVKDTSRAKQRLGAALSQEQRQRLALAMMEDVLTALCASKLDGIIVVTADAAATEMAARYAVRILPDRCQEGQTAAVRQAASVLAEQGCDAMLAVPGDVPLISVDEVHQLLALGDMHRHFVIAPAHDMRGSNAVLCAPSDATLLKYGNDSFFPHLLAAAEAGLEPRIVRLPGIALDLDTPPDLHEFLRRPSPTKTYALLKKFKEEGIARQA